MMIRRASAERLRGTPEERADRWRLRVLAEGRAEGIAEGIAEGRARALADQRKLLCRLAAHRFGAGAAEKLAHRPEAMVDPSSLAEVGVERVDECPQRSHGIGGSDRVRMDRLIEDDIAVSDHSNAHRRRDVFQHSGQIGDFLFQAFDLMGHAAGDVEANHNVQRWDANLLSGLFLSLCALSLLCCRQFLPSRSQCFLRCGQFLRAV